jgi:hypothetical protein
VCVCVCVRTYLCIYIYAHVFIPLYIYMCIKPFRIFSFLLNCLTFFGLLHNFIGYTEARDNSVSLFLLLRFTGKNYTSDINL